MRKVEKLHSQEYRSRLGLECAMCVDCRPAIAQLVVDRGWHLLELRAVGISLEDVFLELTAEQKAMK